MSFIVKSLDSTQTNQAVMFGDMSEAGNPYPGIVFRTAKANNENFQIVANSNSTNSGSQFAYSANTHIVIRRLNDHIYYSTDGGEHFTNYTAAEYSSFTNPFNVNATFGAGIDGSGNPFRYLIGTLSDLKIDVTERDSYTINYNANGGTGSMDSQSNYVGRSYALRKNTFTKTNKIFKEWNTKADGTGTSYHDEQTVTDIANADESVTLYAQWTDPVSYNVSFNANGGTGSMADQTFYIGSTQRLRTNTFTKTGSEFIEWNTKADGTGNHYRDAESVKDLTNTANTTVTLYAQWTKSEYYHSGVVDFDGNTYINTGVRLFDATNINKDFTISFTIESAENVSSQTSLATIISTMDEAHGSPWPGVVLHRNNTNNYYVIEINVTATNSARVDITDNMDIVIQRRNGVVSYSIDGGSTFESTTGDYNNLSSGRYFSDMVLIGASPNQNGIGVRRTFKGRIKNISVVRNDS